MKQTHAITIPDQTAYATCTSLSSNTNTTCQLPFLPVAESTPIKSTQTKNISTSPMVKNEITFSQSLSLSQDTPLSKEEEHLTTHLVKRKLNTDLKKTNNILQDIRPAHATTKSSDPKKKHTVS